MAVVIDWNPTSTHGDGFYEILSLVEGDYDDHDPWGSIVSWLFTLGDVYYLKTGECLPEFHPSPLLHSREDIEEDDWQAWEIRYIDESDIKAAFMYLSEIDSMLRELGYNY